jgi:hypothetical protein
MCPVQSVRVFPTRTMLVTCPPPRSKSAKSYCLRDLHLTRDLAEIYPNPISGPSQRKLEVYRSVTVRCSTRFRFSTNVAHGCDDAVDDCNNESSQVNIAGRKFTKSEQRGHGAEVSDLFGNEGWNTRFCPTKCLTRRCCPVTVSRA